MLWDGLLGSLQEALKKGEIMADLENVRARTCLSVCETLRNVGLGVFQQIVQTLEKTKKDIQRLGRAINECERVEGSIPDVHLERFQNRRTIGSRDR